MTAPSSSSPQKLQDEEDRFEQAQRIALEIVDEARVQLMMKFRFLDVALWKMEPRLTENIGRYALAVDGTYVYYDPYTVIGRFDAGFNEVVRDYLHSIMHCLFRHPYDTTRGNTEAWWLVCDVLAEHAAMELCGKRFASPLDGERKAALEELRGLCGGKLTPGNLYGLFTRSLRWARGPAELRVRGARLNELHALFERDYHRGWPSYKPQLKTELPDDDSCTVESSDDKRESDGRDSGSGGDSSSQDEQRQDVYDLSEGQDDSSTSDDDADGMDGEDAPNTSESSDSGAKDEDGERGDAEAGEADDPRDEVDESTRDPEENEEERSWEELAKQVETDLETFSASWGCEAGGFTKLLSAANRKKTDYSDFLRRFASLSEEMKINDDEFDYVFYTYGLKLYGNMPLVEPLEYKETNRIRDFAICIDTSESCEGELVKKFVEHTFNILKKQEDCSHEVNIHVIQCDAKVQSDTKIGDLRDVDRLMESFTIRGMGGTDFRPAFSYVDKLRRDGELSDLKGIIYFTDGIGDFPEKVPDYDTAFVFLDEGDNYIPKVPPWAMRVLIDKEGINRFKSKLS
ncbi:VWA-like domain-containing protein [Adlercreutzia sp. ZJ473]|uniref:vWA domain-containing protein n=1 Tax=Adlercreutzia sp. ZJ473 TaxID=2722822 RepID=UPI001557DE13|nr:VWA-like domain-containing protein [Adlercreutzia sp. ZJ473]